MADNVQWLRKMESVRKAGWQISVEETPYIVYSRHTGARLGR